MNNWIEFSSQLPAHGQAVQIRITDPELFAQLGNKSIITTVYNARSHTVHILGNPYTVHYSIIPCWRPIHSMNH